MRAGFMARSRNEAEVASLADDCCLPFASVYSGRGYLYKGYLLKAIYYGLGTLCPCEVRSP